jgi:thiol-disulfide isomerase/thioredoxin
MKHITIDTLEQLKEETTDYKHVILRFSTEWCSGCVKIKKELDEFIKNLDNSNMIFVDVNFNTYETDNDFQNYIFVNKLPTFYCENKFDYSGTDLTIIKSNIISLQEITEDF